jgi:hypothetical protein
MAKKSNKKMRQGKAVGVEAGSMPPMPPDSLELDRRARAKMESVREMFRNKNPSERTVKEAKECVNLLGKANARSRAERKDLEKAVKAGATPEERMKILLEFAEKHGLN